MKENYTVLSTQSFFYLNWPLKRKQLFLLYGKKLRTKKICETTKLNQYHNYLENNENTLFCDNLFISRCVFFISPSHCNNFWFNIIQCFLRTTTHTHTYIGFGLVILNLFQFPTHNETRMRNLFFFVNFCLLGNRNFPMYL